MMMQRAFGLAAALTLGAAMSNMAHATPDNTLGMAILAARLNANGAIIQRSGGTTLNKSFPGIYHVGFNRDVSKCFYTVTLIVHQGQTRAQPSSLGVTKVAVTPHDSSGAFKDADFYLLVYCNK
jgi:hypothetical protein